MITFQSIPQTGQKFFFIQLTLNILIRSIDYYPNSLSCLYNSRSQQSPDILLQSSYEIIGAQAVVNYEPNTENEIGLNGKWNNACMHAISRIIQGFNKKMIYVFQANPLHLSSQPAPITNLHFNLVLFLKLLRDLQSHSMHLIII